MDTIKQLTKDESDKLTTFIGKMVRKNVSFGVLGNKVGLTQFFGIQELYNQNLETLRQFGQKLEQLDKSNGGRFSTAGPYLVGGVVVASDMMDMLEFMMIEKSAEKAKKAKENEIASIKKQLEGMKTEGEIKTELQQKLAALEGAEMPVADIKTL